jgi:hypothetical protein
MSKGKATFRQSDLERAMRAVRAFGTAIIEVRPDGTIRIIPPDQYYAGADIPSEPVKKHKKMF